MIKTAILIYNDNAVESPRWPWYQNTYRVVQRLKAKGLIDAVGMQAHLNQPGWTGVPSDEEFRRSIRSFRQLGVEVYLTEMEVGINDHKEPDRFLYQAGVYYRIIKTYLEETRGQRVRIINFFGLLDRHSWEEKPDMDPLLFDDYGKVKPAYYAVLQALYEEALQH